MRRIYVGRLSHHIREKDVERFFRTEGKVRDVLMKNGYAFVEFDHMQDAEAAVRHLNGRQLNGERVHVEFAKGTPRGRENGRSMGSRGFSSRDELVRGPRREYGSGTRTGGISYAEKYGPPRNTDYRVIVENLSSRVSWQDLKDLMRQAGEVTFADAHRRERNVGVVDFATSKDMRHAIDTLNDKEFHGRRIKVFEDESRRYRGSGGSGGRDSGNRRASRSRSRSRGRSQSRSRSGSPRGRSRSPTPRGRSRSGSPRVRSRSRSESPRARSRSESPRGRPAESRSRSRGQSSSRSPSRERPAESRSRSRERSKSRSNSRDRQAVTRSRSRSSSSSSKSGSPKRPAAASRSRSASRSSNSETVANEIVSQ